MSQLPWSYLWQHENFQWKIARLLRKQVSQHGALHLSACVVRACVARATTVLAWQDTREEAGRAVRV